MKKLYTIKHIFEKLCNKQGPQGPQKLGSLKSLKIKKKIPLDFNYNMREIKQTAMHEREHKRFSTF